MREAGRAYKCDSEPIPGRYLIRAGLRPPSPEAEVPSAAGPGGLPPRAESVRSLPKKLELETRFSDSVLQLKMMQGYLKQKGESLFTWLSLRRFIFAEVLSPLRGTLEVPSRTQQTEL